MFVGIPCNCKTSCLEVPLPHWSQISPESRHQDGWDESEGNQVEQSWLGGVHQEEGDEGGDQTKDVSHGGDHPVELVPGKTLISLGTISLDFSVDSIVIIIGKNDCLWPCRTC